MATCQYAEWGRTLTPSPLLIRIMNAQTAGEEEGREKRSKQSRTWGHQLGPHFPGAACQLLMPPGSTGWCQLWHPETRVLLLLSPPPHAQAPLLPPDPHGYGVRCVASVIISCLSFSCCKRLPTAKQHTRFAMLFPTAIKVTPQGRARQRNDS